MHINPDAVKHLPTGSPSSAPRVDIRRCERNHITYFTKERGMVTTVEFDHAQALAAEFLAWGDSLRKESAPVFNTAHGGFWVVTNYEDIHTIDRDHERFASGQGITIPPLGQPVPVVPAESDEPNHSHYRSVLSPFLTPTAVRGYEAVVRALVNERIDRFIERGSVDVVPELAIPVPVFAMARVFGLSDDEAKQFFDAFTEILEAAASGDMEKVGPAVSSFIVFINAALDDVRSRPADMTNIYSAIVNSTIDGRAFDEGECVGLLWSTTAAATETTTHAIGHAMHLLATRPDVKKQLIADPGLIPAAVEEVLRMDAPNHTIARTVTVEVEIGGVTMKAGDRVLLMYGFANRDPETFPEANEFIVDRTPNRHLTFGHGIHTCVGLHLARQEVRTVVDEVLKRMPDFELAGDPGLPRLRGGLMWGFDSLPITFTPGPRVA
jgi:cytochrome P450